MNHDPSKHQNVPFEDSLEPNEDGCVLGTAGRNEDPNATTDWNHPSEGAREKLEQQPSADKAQECKLPPNGTPGIDIVPEPRNGDVE